MSHLPKFSNAVAIAAVCVIASPLIFGGADMPLSSSFAAFAAGKSESHGGGNGGRDHSSSGKSDSSQKSKSSSTSKSSSSKTSQSQNFTNTTGSSGKQSRSNSGTQRTLDTTSTTVAEAAPVPEFREKNIHAQLAGLNSLRRNTNGLMNSSDPRMEAVREYLSARDELVEGTADRDAALLTFSQAQTAFNDLLTAYEFTAFDGSGAYADPSLGSLTTRLDELNAALIDDPENVDLIAERGALSSALDELSVSPELSALQTAQLDLAAAQERVDELEGLTSDDALTAALLEAANRNRVAEADGDYVTGEILDWAKNTLGIVDPVIVEEPVIVE